MASVSVGTTTDAATITHGRNIVYVPSSNRVYVIYFDGTNLVYEYSDDNANFSSPVTITNFAAAVTAFYDSVNSRLNIVYGGGNNANTGLSMRAITSNAATGVPGALTTETVIDAGGSNLGVVRPYAFHSATGSNPRYWVIATKLTAATTYQTRAWYAGAGATADAGANWSSTNFTDLGANSDSNSSKCGVGIYWQVSGVDKVTLVFQEGSSDTDHETVTFDPTAATPTPGTVGVVTGSAHHNPVNIFGEGAILAIAAKSDYLMVSSFETTSNDVNFFKTVNGTTWTKPSGWADLVMGRHQLASDGTNFYLLYADAYGALATTDENLSYRKITTATDAMGSAVAFSDTQGNGVSVPEQTGAFNLLVFYRGSTASPYTVRFDFVDITVAPTQLKNMMLMGVS